MSTQTQSHSILKFLGDVAEQRLGYRFGDPERVTPDSLSVVIPIIRETSLSRQYILLSEAGDSVEMTDTGRINRMRLRNNGKQSVFVRSGTIFRGGTQERTLTRSAILFPGTEVELDVRCVHHSKGIKSGAKVTASGFTPLDVDKDVYGAGYAPKDQSSYWNSVASYSQSTQVLRGEKTEPIDKGDDPKLKKLTPEQMKRLRDASGRGRLMRTMQFQPEDPTYGSLRSLSSNDCHGTTPPMVDPNSFDPQASVSAQDLRSSYAMPRQDGLFDTAGAAAAMSQGHAAKRDDLASTIDSVASNLDDLLSKVKRQDHQVGVGLLTEKGLQCVELFDLEGSWEAIHKDVVARVGSNLAAKDVENVFDYKPKAALSTIAAVLADDYKVNSIFEHKPSNGEPSVKIFGLTSDRFVGEVVELDGRVMHVSLIRLAV